MNIDNLALPVINVVFTYVMWLIPLMLGVQALKALIVPKIHGIEGERQVKRIIKKLNLETLNDVILPDGKGGLTQIDHIVLLSNELLVIETKNYNGILMGTKNDRTWTHKIGRNTHYPQNPIRQNYLHIKSVLNLVPNVPVRGLVVFTNNSKFPKGIPEGVVQLRQFKNMLNKSVMFSPSIEIKKSWEKLKLEVKTDSKTKKEHLKGIFEKHGTDRKKQFNLTILSISVVWILIMFAFSHSSTDTNKTTKSSSQFNARTYYNPVKQDKNNEKKIIEYKEVWVYGKSLEQCMGKKKELNEFVLKCRNGYKKTVPVYK